MSLDPRDNDGGTWGIAMTSHGPLKMTRVAEDGLGAYLAQGMKPLGSKEMIKDFISTELDHVRRQTPGGVLPRVIVVPIADSPTPLVIPAALPRETILSFQTAASMGVDALADVVGVLDDTSAITEAQRHEEMWLANHPDASDRELREELKRWRQSTGGTDAAPTSMRTRLENLRRDAGLPVSDEEINGALAALDADGSHDDASAMTSVQNYAALASVVGSVAQVAYDSATVEGAGSEALQTAKRVFDTAAPICDALAVATTSVPIAAAIFEALALVCRFISWLLDALAEYTISPQEGWDAEWDISAGKFIVRERLRILALASEDLVGSGPGPWAAHFDKLVADGSLSSSEQAEMVKDWVRRTAMNRGPERVSEAKAIAQILGGRGATSSFNMIDDMKNWLLYVGMKPERADMVFTWLYEARKVSIVYTRQRFLAQLRGDQPHEGPGYGVEYRGNMATYVGGSNCADSDGKCRELGSHSGCQVNFEYGSARWYKRCRNLDVLNPSEFVLFSEEDLGFLYTQLSTELQVTPMASGAATLTGGRYVPLDAANMREVALRMIYALIVRTSASPARCGLASANGVPVLWWTQSKSSALVSRAEQVATDARSYLVTLQASGSFPTMVAFCGLPNLSMTPAGVYVRPAGRPYAACRIRPYINSVAFKRLAVRAATMSSKTTRQRTVFSAGTGSSSGNTGLFLGGAALAAGAAAFLLLKK